MVPVALLEQYPDIDADSADPEVAAARYESAHVEQLVAKAVEAHAAMQETFEKSAKERTPRVLTTKQPAEI